MWRRRVCEKCGAMFTTTEASELSTSLVVQKHGRLEPFNRDKLFVSLVQAVGHRKDPVEDAGGLCATILAKLLAGTDTASVTPHKIIEATLPVLKRFDKAAAVQYAAYHH